MNTPRKTILTKIKNKLSFKMIINKIQYLTKAQRILINKVRYQYMNKINR